MKSLIVAGALLALATPAVAQDWKGNSGDNYDVLSLDDGCAMSSTFSFDGRSDVRFFLVSTKDDGVLLSLTSLGWSAEEGKKYPDIAFALRKPDNFYSGGAVGHVEDYIYKGFIAAFEPEFLDDFGAAQRLMVVRIPEGGGDMSTITDLNLAGSGAAVSAFKKCTAFVNAREEKKRKKEEAFDYIERDPFKK